MKKAAAAVLVVAIILSLSVSVQATDEPQGVTVSDLGELLEAIEAAQDGDTISVDETITISEDVVIGEAGKTVNLLCAGDFTRSFFNIVAGNSAIFQGLSFDGQYESSAISNTGGTLTCRECAFMRCHGGVYANNKPEPVKKSAE